nr:hypothetical protein [Tanacetum cinerariifolium]
KTAPKSTTRRTPAITKTTTTTLVTNAQLKALINQGVAEALAARGADRIRNGEDSRDTRTDLKKKMTNKYCLRGKIKKLKVELWNLKVKELDKIERYIGDFTDMIYKSVMASKPETMQDGAPVSTDTELGGYMREFETRVRQDTDEIYMRLDDEYSERQLLAGQVNMLFRDRHAHAYTRHLMETEARMSREAWMRSTDTSDLVRGEVMSLRTTVLGQMTEIRELHAVDRRRQTVISKLLRTDHKRSTEIIKDSLEVLHNQSYQRRLKQMAPRRTTRSTADQETINATSVTNAQLQAMIDQEVTAALAARDALRSTNGDDSHNSGTGTEGVASLSQWCERMESVFHISNCTVKNQLKFATCTLHSVALTW